MSQCLAGSQSQDSSCHFSVLVLPDRCAAPTVLKTDFQPLRMSRPRAANAQRRKEYADLVDEQEMNGMIMKRRS